MRYILLLTVLFATFLSADTQIVIGTFSKETSAHNVKNKLKNIIRKDSKLNKFLIKNNIKAIAKQDGKYFIVTLEPIKNAKVQKQLLRKIRKTKFKDAYILKLSTDDTAKEKAPNKEQEAKKTTAKKTLNTPVKKESVIIEEVTPVEITSVKVKPVETKKKEVQKNKEIKELKRSFEQTQIVQNNFVQTHMTEIIASIAILVLLVIYMFIVKNKHKKDQENEPIEQNTIIEDEFDTTDTTIDDYIEDNVEDLEEIEEPISQEDTIDDDHPRSSVTKRKVPPHEKITKENFKEFSGKKLMVAEDNLINQKVISGLLAESGMKLTIVDDGQEVLNELEKDNNYSVVLMDVHMPNVDGFEATKIIRSNPNYSHITVVALSGDIAPGDVNNMRKAGMQENLEKPLKMDSLYDILYAYLDTQSEDRTLKDQPISFKELNIDAGIDVCAGDEDFYKEILRDFLKGYENSSKEIQEYLTKEDLESAEKLLLDIIGVTANIGANNLQEILKKLKQEIHNEESNEYENTFMNYASHFEELKTEIQEYLS